MSPPYCPTRQFLQGARRLHAVLLLFLAAGCTIEAEHPTVGEAPGARVVAKADPVHRAAAELLASREPRRAEVLLAAALEEPGRRSAVTLLLAAEAATARSKWARVDSLLAGDVLRDPEVGAPAQLLLARAALERGQASRALAHARAARTGTDDEAVRARANVFLARAHDRMGTRDIAKAGYTAAAEELPLVSDWLLLRATALERDPKKRARQYERLQGETARRHALIAEAQTLERSGGVRQAIALYERAGEPMHAMRLRAAVASGRAERDRARRELMTFVRRHSGTPEARQAIEMLDHGRYDLTRDEEVTVARSAVEHGPLSRARTGLARAFARRAPTAEERILQASVLAEAGPNGRRQAERLLAQIPKRSSFAGIAALERAKLIRRRGQANQARAAFRAIVKTHAKDTAAASGALLALAEMATDDKRDDAARDAWLTLARRYPTSRHAPRARFEAAILAFAAGRYRAAAAELDSAAQAWPAHADLAAMRYWSGRARAALKDTAGARERWDAAIAASPVSYYAARARQRTGEPAWVPDEATEYTRFRDIEDALTRVDLLEALGMDSEARIELDALVASADSSAERALTVGNAFRVRRQLRRAMALGRRAIALGGDDARAWRLVYPLDEADLLAGEAARRGVDPALVAAVIRHESSFESWVTSPVGARGLMQVMPRVAVSLARAEDIRPWDAEMLYEPETNVRLGVLHLRTFTRHYKHTSVALAAYNAGPGRVARWSKRRGGKDPELFVERIRFPETRSYVREVMVSRDMYDALYDWDSLAARKPEMASR